MKRIILLFATLLPSILLLAQIPNASFENWTTDSSGYFMQPDGWHSTNEQTAAIPGGESVKRDSSAISGNYSASIKTVNIGVAGTPYAGVLTNGYYQSVGANYVIAGGSPIAYTPDTVSFYYKYSTGDTTKGRALFYFYKNRNGARALVGFGQKDLDTSSIFKAMNVRIGHDSLRSAADSVLIIFQSCRNLAAPAQGELVVDAISITGNTGIGEVEADVAVDVYPNPASTYVVIKTPTDVQVAQSINLYSTDGRLVNNVSNNKEHQIRISTDQLPAATYIVRLQWADGRFVHRNIVVVK